jgi:hypothetical protein
MHARRVEPAKEGLAGVFLTLHIVVGRGGGLVVDRFHPFFRERAGVLDGLFADLAKPRIDGGIILFSSLALEHTARAELGAVSRVTRIVGKLGLFLGVEVIKVRPSLYALMLLRPMSSLQITRMFGFPPSFPGWPLPLPCRRASCLSALASSNPLSVRSEQPVGLGSPVGGTRVAARPLGPGKLRLARWTPRRSRPAPRRPSQQWPEPGFASSWCFSWTGNGNQGLAAWVTCRPKRVTHLPTGKVRNGPDTPSWSPKSSRLS